MNSTEIIIKINAFVQRLRNGTDAICMTHNYLFIHVLENVIQILDN